MEESRCTYSIARKYPIKKVWTLTNGENKNSLELEFNWLKPTLLTNRNKEIIAKIYHYKLLSYWKRITLNMGNINIEGKILNKFNSVELEAKLNLKNFNFIKWRWKLGEFTNQIILEDIETKFILAMFKSTQFSYLEVGKIIVPLVFPLELRIFIGFTAAYAYRKVLYAERVK